MNAFLAVENQLSRPVARLVVVWLLECIALFNALPEINDAIWQDEAVALM